MPRSKKEPAAGANGHHAARTKSDSRTAPRARRAKAAGPPPAVGQDLAEVARLAAEARAQVQALRDDRAELARELTAAAGRLSEAVRHAQEQIADVVRQAREARRELEGLRRHRAEPDREPAEPRAEPRRAQEAPAEPPEGGNRIGVTVGNGVVVAEVLPESPAAAAGLVRGDVIEVVNGLGILSATQLREAVHRTGDGEEVTVRVLRAGERHEVRVRLADGNEGDGRNRLGVTVGPGVVVADVAADGPAAAAGLASGDVIDDVNGDEMASGEQLRDVVRRLPAGAEAVLRVSRAGEVREVRIRPDEGPREG